ncbi:hypothetical protein RCL1_004298 [Eukaryota sp. TZLM3-RCL]
MNDHPSPASTVASPVINIESPSPWKIQTSNINSFMKLACPGIMREFLTMSLTVTDTIMIGSRLGLQHLAASNIAANIIYLTLFVPIGSLAAVDSLGTQAVGALDYNKLKCCIHQSMFVAMLLSFVPILSWLFSSSLLQLLRVDDYISSLVSEYLRVQVFSIPFYILYAVYGQKLLDCQGIIWTQVLFLLMTNVLNVISNYFLIGLYEMKGAGIATALSRVWPFAFAFVYLKFSGSCIFPFRITKQVFQPSDLGAYLKISLPATVFLFSENLVFLIWSLIAAKDGEDALAAHSIVMSLVNLAYVTCLGISSAVSIRIGTLVGAGLYSDASFTSHFSIVVSVIVMSVFGLTFHIFKTPFSKLLTNEDVVINLVSNLTLPVALFQLSDGIFATSVGVLRSVGKTSVTAVCALVSYYLVGLPLSLVFSNLFDSVIIGLWYAICVSITVGATFLFLVVKFVNWRHQCQISAQRNAL